MLKQSSYALIVMRIPVLLLIASILCSCSISSNVNTRKPGEPWYYYGYLRDFYRDQSGDRTVSLVWYNQVNFQDVNLGEFRNSIQTLISQGYRKVGFISILTAAIVDPYDIKRLAADKGAQQVVACSFPVRNDRGVKPIITNVRVGNLGHPEYEFGLVPANVTRTQHWYQLLGK